MEKVAHITSHHQTTKRSPPSTRHRWLLLFVMLVMATIGLPLLIHSLGHRIEVVDCIHRIVKLFFIHYYDHVEPNRPVHFLQEIPVIPTHILQKRRVALSNKDINTLPNIMFILADDLGFGALSGGLGVSTPNIDSIAQNGLRFKNAYSGSATCAPSRSALLTGRYPTKMGWEFTAAPKAMIQFFSVQRALRALNPTKDRTPSMRYNPENYDTAPEVLDVGIPHEFPHVASYLKDELGYWNFFFGKWDSGYSPEYSPIAKGFHESLAFHLGGSLYMKPNDPRVVNSEGLPLDALMRYVLFFKISHNNSAYFEPDNYMTDYLSDHVVKLIHTIHEKKRENENMPQSPFYISLNYNAVHDPYQALKSDLTHPEIQLISDPLQKIYAAMVLAIDRGVGKILQALKDTDQYENTIVIFASDNGPADFGGLQGLAKPYRGWKCTLFEGGIHVPFFLQWPAMIPPKCDSGKEREIVSPIMQMDLPVSYLQLPEVVSALSLMAFDTIAARQDIIRDLEKSSLSLTEKYNMDGHSIWPSVFRELWQLPDTDEEDDLEDDEGLILYEDITGSKPRPLFWRSGHYKALRLDEMKMQVSSYPNRIWFYNLTSDPLEEHNLAGRLHIYSQDDLLQVMADLNTEEGIRNIVDRFVLSSDDMLLLMKLISHYQRLMQVDSEQNDALWQPVTELPHCIDQPRFKCSTDDEWVMWPN